MLAFLWSACISLIFFRVLVEGVFCNGRADSGLEASLETSSSSILSSCNSVDETEDDSSLLQSPRHGEKQVKKLHKEAKDWEPANDTYECGFATGMDRYNYHMPTVIASPAS